MLLRKPAKGKPFAYRPKLPPTLSRFPLIRMQTIRSAPLSLPSVHELRSIRQLSSQVSALCCAFAKALLCEAIFEVHLFRLTRPADPFPHRRVCPLSSFSLHGPIPCLLHYSVLAAEMRKHNSGVLLVNCQQGDQDFKAICLPCFICSSSLSLTHFRSDLILRAESSPLNKNLDRCQKMDTVSTPLTWIGMGRQVDFAMVMDASCDSFFEN